MTLHNLLWNNSYPTAEDLSPGPSGLCVFFFSFFPPLRSTCKLIPRCWGFQITWTALQAHLTLCGTTRPRGSHSCEGKPAGLAFIFPEGSSLRDVSGLPPIGSQTLGCGFAFCGAGYKAPRPLIPFRCQQFPRFSKERG